MIVGSAVGGGYDLFARIVARHIVHYIPGNPSVIVQNQPAAGGVVMTNQLYGQGPKDGTVIGVPINGLPTAPLLQSGTQFDATKLICSAAPIGKPTSPSCGTRCRSRASPN
jgi:tripartite-type tricarboxylate transporter receptor subunit TctC